MGNNISGIFTMFRIFLKKLVKEIARIIWEFLSKKRFIKSYKKKKAILLIFLVMLDCFILNDVIEKSKGFDLKTKLVAQRVAESVSTKVAAKTEDLSNGIEEQEASQEVVPQAVREWNGVAEMSAYTSRVEETDGSPCISADNTNICEFDGCVIATNDYPLGYEIEIENIGKCIVKDRMNSRYTGTGNIDLYMGMDLKKALDFGRQQVNIKN